MVIIGADSIGPIGTRAAILPPGANRIQIEHGDEDDTYTARFSVPALSRRPGTSLLESGCSHNPFILLSALETDAADHTASAVMFLLWGAKPVGIEVSIEKLRLRRRGSHNLYEHTRHPMDCARRQEPKTGLLDVSSPSRVNQAQLLKGLVFLYQVQC
jgi:hypothetical protein